MGMTNEQREQAAADLEAARDVLDSEGWIRGQLSSEDGYCLVGAIWAGVRDEMRDATFPQAAQAALIAYLQLAYPDETRDAEGQVIAHVNDHVLRDRQEAMDVLAKAAIATRERVD
jgi:hypothetical protein